MNQAVNQRIKLLLDSERVQKAFWIVFIILPFVTGIFHYSFLPNEYYDQKIHDLLASHQVCNDDNGKCGDLYDAWKRKDTGEIFTRDQFEEHRWQEAYRVAPLVFIYGMIGCFAFAYFNRHESENAFFKHLGITVCLNVGICVFLFIIECLQIFHPSP